MFVHQVGDAQQMAGAFVRGDVGPGRRLKPALRGANGEVDIERVGKRDGRQYLLGRRVDHVERLARYGRDLLAVDEQRLGAARQKILHDEFVLEARVQHS